MKTIRNTEVFNDLIKESKKSDPDYWEVLFDENGHRLHTYRLAGGLDHVEVKPKGVYFYDRCMNDRDNSFVIRPEL